MTTKLTESSPLSEALARDPDLKDRLIGLHPVLAGLGIPGVGRYLADKLTIARTANLAGLDVSALLQIDAAPTQAASDVHIDVRDYLAGGQSPLPPVMEAALTIPVDGNLIVDAPFDPMPLRDRVDEMGFESSSEQVGDGHWRIRFHRIRAGDEGHRSSAKPTVWTEGGVIHIDVSDLDPPQPLVAICALLEAPDTGDEVIVHHDREPHFLYPELSERGWSWEPLSASGDGLDLRLTRGQI